MAIGVFSPTVPQSAKDIMLGEGIVKFDNDVVGATRGGSSLEIDKEIREMNFDGAYGAVKGLRRAQRFVPKLVVNFLNLTPVLLQKGIPVTVVENQVDEDGTYDEVQFDLEIKAEHVIDSLKFEGQKHNGDECVIEIQNALNIDNITLDFKEKDEIVAEMTYTAFYDYATPTAPPVSIQEEI